MCVMRRREVWMDVWLCDEEEEVWMNVYEYDTGVCMYVCEV